MAINTNVNIPYSPFLDEFTGRPSRAWLLWLMSPDLIQVNIANAVPVTSGGTGTSQIPLNGQILIGNGADYSVNYLTADTGIGITYTLGNIILGLSNSGVTAGSYGSASSVAAFTVNVKGQVITATNTPIAISATQITSGTIAVARGGTDITSYTIGDLIYASGSTTLSKLADVATGNALISGGVGVAPSWGKIGLTTHVSGLLPVANGGTGVTTSTGSGANVLGTRPTIAITGAGLTLQDATDNTKQANFNLAGLTTATTYSYSLPAVSSAALATLGNLSQTFLGNTTFTNILNTFGSATATSTTNVASGVTATGNTNTINVGNAGAAGSTTAIAIGSTLGTSITTLNGVVKKQTYTVTGLPSAATLGIGATAFVTDALAPAFGATVVGSGAVAVPVYSDGTNWKVG